MNMSLDLTRRSRMRFFYLPLSQRIFLSKIHLIEFEFEFQFERKYKIKTRKRQKKPSSINHWIVRGDSLRPMSFSCDQKPRFNNCAAHLHWKYLSFCGKRISLNSKLVRYELLLNYRVERAERVYKLQRLHVTELKEKKYICGNSLVVEFSKHATQC